MCEEFNMFCMQMNEENLEYINSKIPFKRSILHDAHRNVAFFFLFISNECVAYQEK